MKSFRIRIILWTTIIAGAVMLGFGIAGNLAFEQIKEKQVADDLRVMIGRAFPPPSHTRFWTRFGPEAIEELERRMGADAVIAVYGRERRRDAVEDTEPDELMLISWGNLKGLYAEPGELPEVSGRFDPSEERGRGPLMGPGQPGLGGRDRALRMDSNAPRLSAFSRVNAEDGSHWRIAQAEHKGFTILIGVNFEKVREDTALMRKAFAIAFPVALLALAACIWVFVTKAISPVRKLSNTIASVSAQSLGARLSSAGEYSEFAALIEHFNSMLGRLEGSFTQATRFSADAAHELKTPLAIIQGQLEVALQEAEDGSEQQKLLGVLLEEAHRLKSITRKLLILAKADAGTLETQRSRVDLKALILELIELAQEDDPSVDLELLTEGESFDAFCDATLSRQILNNLIGNALKYRFPADSRVTITLKSNLDTVSLDVSNRCETMDKDSRSRLFDRFIRGDAARNRALDGAGLGLSLSLEFAKAQNGRLSIVDVADLEEMRIRLVLPAFSSQETAAD